MEILGVIVGLLIGMLIGLLIGILFVRQKSITKDEAQKQIELQKKEDAALLASTKAEADFRLANIKTEAAKNLAQTKTDMLRFREESLREQERRFNETLQKVIEQLKNATDKMLKEREKEFSIASGLSIGQIVNPLKDSIEKMKQTLSDSSKEQSTLSGILKTQIENAMHLSEAAKASAEELSRVFKHDSKIQGDWGETILNNLLAGQGAHYDIQETLRDAQGNLLKNESGHALRPDVILHLDKKRDVIIDSKVSMKAFMDYVNAETEETRAQALAAHIASIKKHVDELSRKDYSSYVKPPKVRMDYVIMFVPHTQALWTAMNAAPTLWSEAMAKRVYIVDEQTLYAALRIIDLTWTQIAQAQNHEKVYELANEMIDRVGQFVKKYQAIGTALSNAQKAYEDGEKKLAPNGQSVIVTCNKLIKLGARQSDKNPVPELIDIDDALLKT